MPYILALIFETWNVESVYYTPDKERLFCYLIDIENVTCIFIFDYRYNSERDLSFFTIPPFRFFLYALFYPYDFIALLIDITACMLPVHTKICIISYWEIPRTMILLMPNV